MKILMRKSRLVKVNNLKAKIYINLLKHRSNSIKETKRFKLSNSAQRLTLAFFTNKRNKSKLRTI